MHHFNAQIEICAQKQFWCKVLVSTAKHPCPHTRHLVSVTAVGGFSRKKTFHHAGRHPHSPAIGQVLTTSCRWRWSASKQAMRHMYCLVTKTLPTGLGHMHCHCNPKILVHISTATVTNPIWIQDSAGYFHVRRKGILKLSTHTE